MRTFTGACPRDGEQPGPGNVENRLISVTGGAAPLTIAYDPLGRIAKTTSGSASTDFLYDGTRLIAEYDSTTAAMLRSYVHGNGTDEPLLWLEGATYNDPRWLYADRQGSITGTAGTTGVVTPYTYGPYGEPASWAGSRFRYTGQIALPEAQLYHYKARAYDPATGRFLQTDPIGYGDGMNVYAYVRGDPVNLEDTSGLDPYDLYDSEARAANAAILDTHSLLMSTGLEPISRIFRTNDGQFTYVPFVVGTVNRSSTENLAGAVSIFLNTGHFATQVSSIHGHPGSSPPSRDDLKHDANAHMTGIVVSMNGRVDVHKPPNENNRFDSTGIMANVNDANTVEELVVTANRNVEAQIGAGQSGGGFWQGLGNALGNLGSAISSGFRGILEWLTKLF